MDDNTFLISFRNVKIFYSTPYGDHKDGGCRPLVLPDGEKSVFVPVFTSAERAKEFYENAGRVAYMIMEASFLSFLETTSAISKENALVPLGVVIDPGYYGVTISANMLDNVICAMSTLKS